MFKNFQIKSWLLLLMVMGASVAWADTTVTFSASADKAESATGDETLTKDGITIVSTVLSNGSYYQCYKNDVITISSSVGNIKEIVFTCTANGSAKYGPGSITVNDNVGTYTAGTDKVGTWTGSAASVSFTASNNQLRASQIDVTFESSEQGGENEKTMVTISWSVDGKVTEEKVEQGKVVTFAAPSIELPEGKAFVGWVTTATVNADTAPTTVTTATADADITYYAVFADEESSLTTATLTGDEIKSNIASSKMAYGTAVTYTDTADGVTWEASANTDAAGRPWFQLKKDATSYFKITAGSNISNVKLTITSASNSKGGIADITKHTAYSGLIYLESAATSTPTGEYGSTSTISDNVMEVTPTSDAKEVYVVVGSGARIWGAEVTYGSFSRSNYTTMLTTSTTITVNAACNDGNGNYYATFYTDRAYVMHDMLEGQVVSVDNDGVLTVETVYESGDVVPAKTALLIYALEGGDYEVNYTTDEGVDMSEFNMLKGTLTADEMTEGIEGEDCLFYRLTMQGGTKIGFWWGAADGQAFRPGANKAYLAVPVEQAAKVQGFSWTDGVATGIENIDHSALNIDHSSSFNLNGQRVAPSYKGISIVNGKKYINQ